MNQYINLTLENIEKEHICCAIGDKKHQAGVTQKKEWIKNKIKMDMYLENWMLEVKCLLNTSL